MDTKEIVKEGLVFDNVHTNVLVKVTSVKKEIVNFVYHDYKSLVNEFGTRDAKMLLNKKDSLDISTFMWHYIKI